MNIQQQQEEYNIKKMTSPSDSHLPYRSSSRKPNIVSLLSDAIVCSRTASCCHRHCLSSTMCTCCNMKVSDEGEKDNSYGDDDISLSSCQSFASFPSTNKKQSISDLLLSLPIDKSFLNTGSSSSKEEGDANDYWPSFDFDIAGLSSECDEKKNNEFDEDTDDNEASSSSFNANDYSSSSDDDDKDNDNDDEVDDDVLLEDKYQGFHQKRQDQLRNPRKVRFRDVTIREYSTLTDVCAEGTSNATTGNDNNNIINNSCMTTMMANNATSRLVDSRNTTSAPETMQMSLSLFSIQKQLQHQQYLVAANTARSNHHHEFFQNEDTATNNHPNHCNDIVMYVDDYEWIQKMKSYVRILEKTSKTVNIKNKNNFEVQD